MKKLKKQYKKKKIKENIHKIVTLLYNLIKSIKNEN